jgi:N-acetylneuraminic acid mutarotase
MVKILIFCLFVITNVNLFSVNNWHQLTPITSTPTGRNDNGVSRINNDSILIFGGETGTGRTNETWIYSLSKRSWYQQNPSTPPSNRMYIPIERITDDKILFFGGNDGIAPELSDTWVYDVSDGQWTQLTPATTPPSRMFHSLAYIGDDKVLMFGGNDTPTPLLSDTWVYDYSDGNWTQLFPGASPSARRGASMSYIGDDKVILFGGGSGGGVQSDTWIFDLSDGNWTNVAPATTPTQRMQHGIEYLGGDQVIMFGGYDGVNYINSTYIYDLSDGNWTNVAPATSPSIRGAIEMGAILDEKIILFGGGDGIVRFNEIWIYENTESTLPVINSISSSNISTTNSTINININDSNAETIVVLRYGESSGNYSFNDTISIIPAETGGSIINYSINNLEIYSTYFYKISTYNFNGNTESIEYTFTTSATNPNDVDADGVDNTIESSAPNSGDGNNDGLQDSQQANVASLRGISGSYITVQLVSCDSLLNVENFLRTENDNFEFPFGVISFSAPCSEALVKIFYHNVNDLSLYSYRKETASGRWIEYEDSEFSIETIDGEQVAVATLTLSDGGIGDSDGIVNGMIVDPGGPAIAITANIPIWEWWWVLVITPIIIYTYRRFT